MDHEVFIPANGEMFYTWHVRYTSLEERRESGPCTYHDRNGTVRKGKLYYTVESATVSFCAPAGSIRAGQKGQLSSTDDRFYDVIVASVQPAEQHLLVSGDATRKFAYEKDR
jgi:hypothetical protein